MPGKLEVWPTWPEFTESKGEADPTGSLLKYKQEIVSIYGQEAITKAWLKVCKDLETLTEEIAEKGTSIIPEVKYEDMLTLSDEKREELKKRGCFVVRGVVEEKLAKSWFKDVKQFYQDNREYIGGWPEETPYVLRLYWSPTQLAARSHPNSLKLQRILNEFWHDSPTNPTTSPDPLSYADAVRIRPPKIPFYGLGPHIDAGSLCRWADPSYRSVYGKVFSGLPEELDLYDLEKRKDAKQSMDGGYHSTVLRAYQGWTALTAAGKQEGSLLLYPDVKTTIAYVLLRPFFSPPEKEEDIMDASKWTFDISSGWFPGTFKNESQRAAPGSHPHLRIRECMVNIPRMEPGDTIWWHCDMLHAVEVEHLGEQDASVVYVAATPTTEINKEYMRGQVKAFLDGGKVPKDFGGNYTIERDEATFKGWIGEKGILSGEEGRRAAGLVGL
ncbi:uncharacterized protein PAC_01159 [Phialocephala subalpina]|uniref:DUF1479 domain protein n=1 Tax=Phialocephala subalpina TaxID=576137 RepID=A0A1L7WET5_9HELO|nr:uncharacterized protein PAC_01159 [Phialocephala subalpina]